MTWDAISFEVQVSWKSRTITGSMFGEHGVSVVLSAVTRKPANWGVEHPMGAIAVPLWNLWFSSWLANISALSSSSVYCLLNQTFGGGGGWCRGFLLSSTKITPTLKLTWTNKKHLVAILAPQLLLVYIYTEQVEWVSVRCFSIRHLGCTDISLHEKRLQSIMK